MSDEIDLNELFSKPPGACTFHSMKPCDKAGTFRCTPECEFHPESFNVDPAVIERFKKEPWSVYCLTCGEFLETRHGHPEDHRVATGIPEYREKLTQHIIDLMAGREEETGPIDW